MPNQVVWPWRDMGLCIMVSLYIRDRTWLALSWLSSSPVLFLAGSEPLLGLVRFHRMESLPRPSFDLFKWLQHQEVGDVIQTGAPNRRGGVGKGCEVTSNTRLAVTILTLPLVLSQTSEDCKSQNESSNKLMVAVVLVLVVLRLSNHTISCSENSLVGSRIW